MEGLVALPLMGELELGELGEGEWMEESEWMVTVQAGLVRERVMVAEESEALVCRPGHRSWGSPPPLHHHRHFGFG